MLLTYKALLFSIGYSYYCDTSYFVDYKEKRTLMYPCHCMPIAWIPAPVYSVNTCY
jgi:hypothetical protein